MTEQLSAKDYASMSKEDQTAYYLRLYFEADTPKRAEMRNDLYLNFPVDAGAFLYIFDKIDAGEYEPQKVRIEINYTDVYEIPPMPEPKKERMSTGEAILWTVIGLCLVPFVVPSLCMMLFTLFSLALGL